MGILSTIVTSNTGHTNIAAGAGLLDDQTNVSSPEMSSKLRMIIIIYNSGCLFKSFADETVYKVSFVIMILGVKLWRYNSCAFCQSPES